MKYESKKEIYDNFYNNIFPQFEKFEKERVRTLFRMLIIEFILIVIPICYITNGGAVISFFENFDASGLFIFSWMLVIIDIICIFVNPISTHKAFQKKIKLAIMPMIVTNLKSIKYYNKSSVISDEDLRQSTLFGRFNGSETDDAFIGILDNVDFKIAEILLDLSVQKWYSIAFKGVVAIFDLNKRSSTRTIVTTQKDLDIQNQVPFLLMSLIFLGPGICGVLSFGIENKSDMMVALFILLILGAIIAVVFIPIYFIVKNQNAKIYGKQKEVKLEDPEFAKRFKIFSADEVEARCLVTTAFMKRLLNVRTSFGTKKLKCAFFNDQIMLAISTNKNLFEFGSLFKTLKNPKNIHFFNELFSILDMIEYFKLDEKTGL